MLRGVRNLIASLAMVASFGAASAQPSGYELIDLGSFTGAATDTTRAAAVNDLGQVTGSAFTAANRAPHAFFYAGGVLSDLGILRPTGPAGAYFSTGTAMNNAGQVVGQADNVGNRFESFIWQSPGPMTDFADFGAATFRRPVGINDSGVVVGSDIGAGGGVATWSASSGITQLAGLEHANAGAINASGQVTGSRRASPSDTSQAFVTGPNGNTITDLGTLGGSFSTGQALNAAGQVTGISRTAGDAFSRAFFYAGGSGIVDMGTLGGSFSEGMGLNDTGQVVGRASTAGDAQQHAFVSGVNGVGLFDLNWFVSLDAGRYLTEAVGINRWGQIVANDNAGHAFLLSPVPEPQSWAMVALGLVLVGGLRIKQQRRHAANQVS